jgi:hypothetical protein
LYTAISTSQRESFYFEEDEAMGVLTNKVERDELKPGDHIYTYRAVFAYSHHGTFDFFLLISSSMSFWHESSIVFPQFGSSLCKF